MDDKEAYRRWEQGTPLSKASKALVSDNASPNKPRRPETATKTFSPKSGVGMMLDRLDEAQRPAIMKAVRAFESLSDNLLETVDLQIRLKSDLLKKLSNGELLAFGYSTEDAASAPPVQIPQRFLADRFVDWARDMICDPPYEYRQVRITQLRTVEEATLTTKQRRGRPSSQDEMFNALRKLINNDRSFVTKSRKVQTHEMHNYMISASGHAPSTRTISKSLPALLTRLKSERHN